MEYVWLSSKSAIISRGIKDLRNMNPVKLYYAIVCVKVSITQFCHHISSAKCCSKLSRILSDCQCSAGVLLGIFLHRFKSNLAIIHGNLLDYTKNYLSWIQFVSLANTIRCTNTAIPLKLFGYNWYLTFCTMFSCHAIVLLMYCVTTL